MSKIKNTLIFIVITAVLILVYIFFIKPAIDQSSNPLTASSGSTLPSVVGSDPTNNTATGDNQNFLALLLSVKTITLDDSIFSNPAFQSLHDSSITLQQDPNPGRPNPFAPFGSDATVAPIITPVTTSTTTPINTATPSTTTSANANASSASGATNTGSTTSTPVSGN